MRKGVKKGVHHARLRGNDLGRGLRSISAQKHKEMCGDGNYAHGEKEVLIVHIRCEFSVMCNRFGMMFLNDYLIMIGKKKRFIYCHEFITEVFKFLVIMKKKVMDTVRKLANLGCGRRLKLQFGEK